MDADVNSMIQAYERKLKEQNQKFWETAKRMDMRLFDEEGKYAELHEAFVEVEAHRDSLRCCSEARLSEVENSAAEMQTEIEQLRKLGRERAVRHASDMEALSEKLCNAQRRCLEFEADASKIRADAASSQEEFQEE